MKKLTLFYAILVLGIQAIIGQNIHKGHLLLSTQTEINSFKYTEVIGNLTIKEAKAGDITNLSSLASLKQVSGRFHIKSNTNLSDISGLSNLQRVTGNIVITNNHKITSLKAFNNLTELGGKLSIHWNEGLTTLDGFENLTQVGGNIGITSNTNLTNIDGFRNLKYIKGHLTIINNKLTNLLAFSSVTSIQSLFIRKSDIYNLDDLSSLQEIRGGILFQYNDNLNNIKGIRQAIGSSIAFVDIQFNPQLESIEGLEKINNIRLNTNFIKNKKLKNLDPLSNLTRVHQTVNISNNTNLESACGLYKLLKNPNGIGGELTIANNRTNTNSVLDVVTSCFVYDGNMTLTSQAQIDAFSYSGVSGSLTISEAVPGNITDLTPLQGLEFVESFNVVNNTALSNISLPNLKAVRFNLNINNNTSLVGMEFPLLEFIGRTIEVKNNDTLLKIATMPLLNRIGQDFIIYNNPKLKTFGAFSRLNYIKGKLSVTNNPSLVDFTGLESLQEIRDLYINNNTSLTDINAFSLKNIENSIYINNNPSLRYIEGLFYIESVPGDLTITANFALQTLAGLYNLSSIGGNFKVKSNTDLKNACAIIELINDETAVRGTIDFSNNGSIYRTLQDIKLKCNTAVEGDVKLTTQEEVDLFNYRQVGRNLIIEEAKPGLITNIAALESLNRIGGDLIIRNNSRLSNIYPLGTLDQSSYDPNPSIAATKRSIGGDIILDRNPSISNVVIIETAKYFVCRRRAQSLQVTDAITQEFTVYKLPFDDPLFCIDTFPGSDYDNRDADGGNSSKLLSTSTNTVKNKLTLHPTISNGNQITITGATANLNYQIYDATARLIEENNIVNALPNQVIQFRKQLKSGMYFIKVLDQGVNTALRFVVK